MTMAGWGLARRLSAIDVLTMAFVAHLAAGTIALSAQIPEWLTVVLVCAVVAGVVPFLGWLRTHLDLGVVRLVHDWSFAISVYPIYLAVLLVAGRNQSGRVYDPGSSPRTAGCSGLTPPSGLRGSRIRS
jgi:hypothetical protein